MGTWLLQEIPNTLPNMNVKLCTKVSTSWLLPSQPLADLCLQQISNVCCVSPISPINLPSQNFLDLPKLLQESLSISNTLTCYTNPQLACIPRETNTVYRTQDRVKSFLRGLHHKHEIDVLYTQDRHKSPSRERFSCSLYLHSSSIQQCLSHAVHKGF